MRAATKTTATSLGTVVLAAVLLLAKCNPAAAGSYAVWGHGNATCGTFNENYSSHLRGENVPAYTFEITWMQGFLTAENAEWVGGLARNIGAQNLKPKMELLYGIDIDGMAAWVNSYCRTHPLDVLNDAAVKLTGVLIDRAASRAR